MATATACALLGLDCVVYMGAVDIERQSLNVYRMKLLGAEVVPVTKGPGTLKDAVSEAMREWVASVETTHYIIGSVVGPHPFPLMVREFQRVIGEELLEQLDGTSPATAEADVIVACVGGGSNAMGIFAPYAGSDVELVGVEAAGYGLDTGQHGASLVAGSPGVIHGSRTYLLQDDQGQVIEAHSVSAGLDYPGVGPEHSYYKDAGIARYESVTDAEALEAFHLLCRTEGIIPALESAHGLAWIVREAASLRARRSCSISPGAATRTCRKSQRSMAEPRYRSDCGDVCRGPGREPGCLAPLHDGGSARPSRRHLRCLRRWPTPGPTASRSASRIPIRSWTARRFTPPGCGRSRPGSIWTQPSSSSTEIVSATGKPVLVMTYVNPVMASSPDVFAHRAAAAGASGLIVADLPAEEAAPFQRAFESAGLGMVLFVAPTTDETRLAAIAAAEPVFIYGVAELGVTGVRDTASSRVDELAGRVRTVTDIPLVFGVGISTPAHAAAAAAVGDGVIVGSALVHRVLDAPDAATARGERCRRRFGVGSAVRR